MSQDPKRPTHGHGLVGHGPGEKGQGHSGEAADLASDRIEDAETDDMDDEERQEVLVDEAVEETFPASDPISPKRIT